MIKALQDAGSKRAKYKECPGVEHNCWETTYNDPEMYKWLFEQKRTKESAAAKPHKFTEEEIKAAQAQRGGTMPPRQPQGGFQMPAGGFPGFGGFPGGPAPAGRPAPGNGPAPANGSAPANGPAAGPAPAGGMPR